MKLPVLVEPNGAGGFVARVGEPFGWTAEGATADEAVAAVQRLADATPAAVVEIELPEPSSPNGKTPDDWHQQLTQIIAHNRAAQDAGMVERWVMEPKTLDVNDPVIQDWLAEIEEFRRSRDVN